MALRSIEKHYKESIASYAEEMQHHTLEIEKIKNEISLLEKSNENGENTLKNIEHDINYELRLLERLNTQFFKKSEVISELNIHLPDLKSQETFDQLLNSKYIIITALLDEIESLEISLLKHELEKQNLLQQLEPTRQQIRLLQHKLNTLEVEKKYFESTKIHQITQLNFPFEETSAYKKDEESYVDTQIES